MQANRLFEIIYLLIEKENMTAKQLSEKLEVSPRTIYRDVEILSSAGVPIYSNRGKNGGISLMKGYILDKSLLSEHEQDEILFSLKGFKATDMTNSGIMTKLNALFNNRNTDWIDVDFSQWGANKSQKNIFYNIKTAILENYIVYFTYYSSKGEKSFRKIEPVKLIFKNHSWYLQGYCLTKNDYRTFKISRIENLTVTDNKFLKRDIPIPAIEQPDYNYGQMVCLHLQFPAHMAFRVFDEFCHEDIQKTKDGQFIVKVNMSISSWMYGYLLSFGEDIKVLEPESVKKELSDKAKRIIRNYK